MIHFYKFQLKCKKIKNVWLHPQWVWTLQMSIKETCSRGETLTIMMLIYFSDTKRMNKTCISWNIYNLKDVLVYHVCKRLLLVWSNTLKHCNESILFFWYYCSFLLIMKCVDIIFYIIFAFSDHCISDSIYPVIKFFIYNDNCPFS